MLMLMVGGTLDGELIEIFDGGARSFQAHVDGPLYHRREIAIGDTLYAFMATDDADIESLEERVRAMGSLARLLERGRVSFPDYSYSLPHDRR